MLAPLQWYDVADDATAIVASEDPTTCAASAGLAMLISRHVEKGLIISHGSLSFTHKTYLACLLLYAQAAPPEALSAEEQDGGGDQVELHRRQLHTATRNIRQPGTSLLKCVMHALPTHCQQ
jgi:hypothetical protein